MLALNPFQKIILPTNAKLQLDADLKLINSDTIEINFNWQDSQKLILFPESPGIGRQNKLWQQTCFEAFMQPAGQKTYYEINLSTQKAWNVFHFEDYRAPQPPTEFLGADALKIEVTDLSLRALIQFRKCEFKKLKVSLTAVLILKDLPPSFWAFKHADQKPNFHHFDSFVIERNAP